MVTKKCPFCAEEIKFEAIKCKYCGEMLNMDSSSFSKRKNNINTSSKIRVVFSIGLLVSFFLPWFSFNFFELSGYNIPFTLDKVISIGSFFEEDIGILKLSYFLFLIPICSIYNILKVLTGFSKYFLLNEFFIGILCLYIIFYLLDQHDLFHASYLGFGFHFTMVFSFLGVFIGVWQSIISAYSVKNKKSKENVQ